ncbi:MAG: MFS transporter [Candidatus Paralactobacillus gallistercoris]|uniref:MFS transporter n=1 Tax=Candidatus Paralactobacillus gallistercoris TaxID=2838724 RepID=A0A948TKA6_9LACO|nr:MFS transporter [Candidatus Paralactobacillus gallistercoris]
MTVSFQNKLSVIMGSILGFIGILIGTSLVVTFPTLINEFHVSLSDVQWLSSGYYLIATLVMSTTAYLMKSISLKRLFQVASVIFILGSLLAASAHSFRWLLLGCLLDALATGLATPLMYQIVFHNIPSAQFGFYTGIVTMIKAFGPALGPTYGGVLTQLCSWRWLFIGVVPLVLIVLLVGNHVISKNQVIPPTRSFDLIGLLILTITLLSFDWSLNRAGKVGFTHADFYIFLIIGLVLLSIFIYHVTHTKNEYLNFNILKQPIVRLRAISFFNLQFVNLSLAFLLPLFAEESLHLNAMAAGLLLLPGALIGAFTSPMAGKLYDHKGAFYTLMIANSCLLIGVSSYYLLTTHQDALLLGVIYLIFRIGYTFGFGNTLSDAGNYVNPQQRSDVSSLFNTLQQYAGSLGTSLMAAIIALHEAVTTNKAYAVMVGSHRSMVLLVIVIVINIILTIKAHYQALKIRKH